MEHAKPPSDPEELGIAESYLRFPVVGIGASAGGLAALQCLFAEVPADCEMAFVVVMHLSPDHESSLGPILERSGRLPVSTVVESTAIRPGHVYVISPSKKLTMNDGQLHVAVMAGPEGRRQSIDLFFRSLAEAHRERAVCIVLSGTGSDGAQGLKRIKEWGGVALAQSPDDAEFDDMPRAAIETGGVDVVLPAVEMAKKLTALWANAKRMALPDPPKGLRVEAASGDAELLAEEALVSIKALLRERTGHDFAHYKRGTVLRRLERRMQVNSQPDLPSYRRFLDIEPKETAALLQDMLISVTNFFRDPGAFHALSTVLAAAIDGRTTADPFRAWVAGCATGEEAYSIAILLRELLPEGSPPPQIFASDMDQRAIAAARGGLFPASIATTDVSPERLQQFFVADQGGFRIAKSVRDGVVFSVHNVLSDPPFTRMDLICCRNLMIYLDRSAQGQLLRSFNFSLKPRGLLFLGSSETTDAAEGMFDAEDRIHRLYRARIASRGRTIPPLPARLPPLEPAAARKVAGEPARPPLEALHERVIKAHGPPTVLVDADDNVLHVSQRAAHLLRMPEGAPTQKLLALARPELRAELRAAISRATETGHAVHAPRVRLLVNGVPRHISMTVAPALDEPTKGLMLVVFAESDEGLVAGDEGSSARDPLVGSLEADLLRTQDRLRNTVGESSASTEELRASNEELQTINEELRSTTEELETSREELHAVNEELTTVNAELGLKIDETSRANDDLQNLMTSAEIGAVFVDAELRVKRFTPPAAAVFNLLLTDVGRPLLDITHRLDYPQLAADVSDVLRDLRRTEREVLATDGRWLLARVVPYRTAENRIEGAVLAFFDVSARRAAEERLRQSELRMTLVAESMRDYAIVTLDNEGRITSWSAGAERIFGHSADEAISQSIAVTFTPEDRAAGEPAAELSKARETGRADHNRWLLRRDGERVFCSGITTPLVAAGATGYARISRDLTTEELQERRREAALADERAASAMLKETSAMKDQFLATVSHELKNPLSVILMNVQLLSVLPGFEREPRAERVSAAITAAVASQVQIINDLLDLSRANLGKVVLTMASLDLAELVQNIVQAAMPEATAKSQTLLSEIAPAMAIADSVRLEQIVWNMISNAVKFTPVGGLIHVALVVETHTARLSVTDSGIGIAPEHLENIFEMFMQVDAGANRKKTGFGIGLALAKQLAELHGGRMKVESPGLGHGATVTVWLPIVQTPVDQFQRMPPGRRRFSGLRLLLVDDEPDLLVVFGELLQAEGAEVVLADNATQALALARSRPFDVVVSDIAMPERDGYWLAEQLRADTHTRALPLIAVSGMTREVDRQKALAAGFNAHLDKPLAMTAFRSAIARAIAGKVDRDR